MGCMCRCGDDIEAGVVSTTYRCCAAARGYLCHHSQEREECVGLEHSSSFEWRPEGNLEELHLAQPTYVSSCVEVIIGGICWLFQLWNPRMTVENMVKQCHYLYAAAWK
jgi:hypothetical protein